MQSFKWKYPRTFILAAGLLVTAACNDLTSSLPEINDRLTFTFEEARAVDQGVASAALAAAEGSIFRGRFRAVGAVEDIGEYEDEMSPALGRSGQKSVFLARTLTGRRGTLRITCAGCSVQSSELIRGRFRVVVATGAYTEFAGATAMIDPNAEVDKNSSRQITFRLH